MKFLFVTTGSQATVYAVAPLATAVRNAGHELLLAANEPLMEFAEAIGVPAVSITPEPARHFVRNSRSESARRGAGDQRADVLGFGRGFARFASAGLDALLDLGEGWRPDLVVGGSMSYAAGLLATRVEVPYVRHAEYLLTPGVPITDVDPVAEEELRPELTRLGLARLPDPALFLDVCPPSLRPAGAPDAQLMRWIPSNPQRRLEPWMYLRPNGRPRVLITSGTHFRMLPGSSMRHLVDQLALAGAEVLIAASEGVATELGAKLGDDVRVGWMPLDVVAPTCDLTVSHAGATTAMTVLAAGVPQLIIPAPNPHTKAIAQALSGFGAALTVMPQRHGPGQDPAEVIAAGCREILSSPRYAQQARTLARENAALPTPSDMVHTLEKLAAA
ncbi:MAG: glycosyltransferase [Gaiellaceae bacterium]